MRGDKMVQKECEDYKRLSIEGWKKDGRIENGRMEEHEELEGF